MQQALERLKPVALLLARIAIGVIFIYHGLPKLTHPQEWVQNFHHMGFPGYFAYIAAVFEVFGGALLIVGLFTRIAGLLLAGEMAVALVGVHGIVRDPGNVHGYEFPLALAVLAFVLATVGPGAIALDQMLFERRAAVAVRKRA
ncbi:MAG TPA: DoxX family protein [Candidatus Acidoferrales bacterium]|nr:DoxX family protein [Candidatus Acidoferrales bacterium]